ncbi:MAG TPA: hypothetical protein VK430_13025 [Xanthobacteraceae bacterium]|nr:hypothetical protein [Xanthobacteraceae bacterium]
MLSKTLMMGLAVVAVMIGTMLVLSDASARVGGLGFGGGGPSMWAFYPFLDPYNRPNWCDWEKVNYYRHNRLQERWVYRCPH